MERKKRLNDLWEQFDVIQTRIESIEYEEYLNEDETTSNDEQTQQRSNFEDSYFTLMSRYDTCLAQVTRHEIPIATPLIESNNVNYSQIRLPKIELPTFSGSYEEWCSYHDSFDSMIQSNPSISKIQKFHYLRSSLKGKAAEVIQSFEITSENYDEAWEMLKTRFDNKRWIVQGHIKAIFDMPTIQKENHTALRNLVDSALKHMRALKALKRPVDQWDDLVIHLIISKLDPITNKEWETSLPGNDIPSLKNLTDFLSQRCRALEAISSKMSNLSMNTNYQKPSNINSNKSKGSVSHVAACNIPCSQCKENHFLYHCEAFKKFPASKRIQIVNDARLCKNCLRTTNHQSKSCPAGSCQKCGKRHNTLLHLQSSENEGIYPVTNSTKSSNEIGKYPPVVTQCSQMQSATSILLSTAIIEIYDEKGRTHSCRALLDSGSQINFITQKLAKQLQLTEKSVDVSFSVVKNASSHATRTVNAHIKSRFNKFNFKMDSVVLPEITQKLPQENFYPSDFMIPKNIKLADPSFHISAEIDMLIGAELFWSLICVGQIRPSKSHPVLQKTQLGWIISGQVCNVTHATTALATCHLSTNNDLNQTLSKFWKIEHDISAHELSPEERVCRAHFEKTTYRNEEGRYIVHLPIKADKLDKLGDSRDIAERRFLSLERRLDKQPKLKSEYINFIREYKQLGHMRESTNERFVNHIPRYYLPHHSVVKETSTTTKLRVVFDGSCKTSSGISLNDTLMVGPTLQEDLFSILVRFRTFQYAITADIEKMYRQVLVDSSQTPLQCILWRESPQETLKTYELTTVTYGTASASFLAIASLRRLAEDEITLHPLGSKIILRDFYVDDMLTGANSAEEAQFIQQEMAELLKKGCFILRKWVSNLPSLQPKDLQQAQVDSKLADDHKSETRTLGIIWNWKQDHFKFTTNTNTDINKPITKREILSKIALIFDPLGLLGPVVLTSKIIMQELWRLSIDWDETVPMELHSSWIRFERELANVNNIRIPRRIITCNEPKRIQLHGFCDASELANGACVYLRTTSPEDVQSVRLICSKSRVAPLKLTPLTYGQILLSFLAGYVQIVENGLHLLRRVGEIQQITSIQQWHHVRTDSNPADPLSRGVMPASLGGLEIWWNGPHWLYLESDQWPHLDISDVTENLPEEKRTQPTIATIIATQDDNIFTKFSSFNRLIRVIARCQRFIYNIKNPTGRITDQQIRVDEIVNSTQTLVKMVQRVTFENEITSLNKALKAISNRSPILKLNPFLDRNDVLRVGGRLSKSSLPYATTHPALLPGHHPFTILIIRYEHIRHLHAGAQATLAAVRQNYWPCFVRNVVRSITRNCITCFRSNPKSASPIMGELPESRVIPSRPFKTCGVDYAGPLYMREGNRKNTKLLKGYIAIFVCLSTKAFHIELAMDMSTEAFLNALKRFIARRGRPTDIYSDNGSNFVGAERELYELTAIFKNQEEQNKIINCMTCEKIQWHFIPPRAPHFGGIWEAAVKATKRHFYRTIGDTSLKYDELTTLLTQIEAILNSRPLTPLSSDPNDLIPLTPGHFLIGDSLTTYHEPSIEHLAINRLSRWQRIEQLRQHFWRRWSKEYLHLCQERQKWRTCKGDPLKIGQLVIVKEDNLPPLVWALGRIEEIYPGNDGIVRTATIPTGKGSYKRPATRLCILPNQ